MLLPRSLTYRNIKGVTAMTFKAFIKKVLEYMDQKGMLDDLKEKYKSSGGAEKNRKQSSERKT